MDHETSASGLYRLEVDPATTQAPVLVHTLRGAIDAGAVGSLVADHLLDSLPVQRVATFVADELVDYRSRRPPMLFEDFAYRDYEDPVLALDLLRDDEGRPLLLLHGVEPDLRWDAFVGDVAELARLLGVRQVVGVHGMPGPVPHTRPVSVTSHGAELERLEEERGVMIGTVQVPGSAAGLLELRLGRDGFASSGLSATVPHYLAQNEYPPAAAEAVRRLARATELALPVGELEAAATQVQAQIAAQVGQSPEVAAVVEALEKQYDQFAQVADPASRERSLESARPRVPSAEEIGAEAEAFLAAERLGTPDAGASTDEGASAAAPSTGAAEEAPTDDAPAAGPRETVDPREGTEDEGPSGVGRLRWPWRR